MRSASSTQQATNGSVWFCGVILLIIGVVAGVHITRTYAFYLTAHSTTQGTVQDSYAHEYENCTNGECTSTTICTTIVIFAPPSQNTSFTTTDSMCGTLDRGTKVEVLYDRNNPSTAKTSRQASADVTWAVVGIIGWPILAFIFTVVVAWEVLEKSLFRRLCA
jgi:hypothetical protein